MLQLLVDLPTWRVTATNLLNFVVLIIMGRSSFPRLEASVKRWRYLSLVYALVAYRLKSLLVWI